ncbi:MAG: hypothetical protein R6T85_11410 [Egibacteraceae bacterium]
MVTVPAEDQLSIVRDDVISLEDDPAQRADDRAEHVAESLRDAFVDAFNARDVDGVLAVTAPDVECADGAGDGAAALGAFLVEVWERHPGVVLTAGELDGQACAVAWLPDEDGCWARAALVTLSVDDGLLDVVALPDDVDGLDRVLADEPVGDELEDWLGWVP